MNVYLIVCVTAICGCLLVVSFSLYDIAYYIEKLYYEFKNKNDGE